MTIVISRRIINIVVVRGLRNIINIFMSSIVDDGTRGVLNLLRKDPTRTKSTKSMKSTKCIKNDFFHLRCYFAHKKHKKHKTSNKRLLPLRCFYAHKNAVFFIFIGLCAFCAFYPKQAIFFLLVVFMHI